MDISLFYITAKDLHEAQSIGRSLVKERIAACANIFDPVHSIYHWEGSLCESEETVLVVKTKKALATALINRVRELHSYTCPCIVELPIVSGNSDFLRWVESETTSEASPQE